MVVMFDGCKPREEEDSSSKLPVYIQLSLLKDVRFLNLQPVLNTMCVYRQTLYLCTRGTYLTERANSPCVTQYNTKTVNLHSPWKVRRHLNRNLWSLKQKLFVTGAS